MNVVVDAVWNADEPAKMGRECRDMEASQQHEQTKVRDRKRMVTMVTMKVCDCAVEEPRAAESISSKTDESGRISKSRFQLVN